VDALLSVIVLLALAAPLGLAAAWFSSRGGEAMSSLFRTDRGLGWPRGIQEEDPAAWNWERRQAAAPSPVPVPIVEAVAFRVRRRSARRAVRDKSRSPLPR
jgi:hypothetical protein